MENSLSIIDLSLPIPLSLHLTDGMNEHVIQEARDEKHGTANINHTSTKPTENISKLKLHFQL